MENERKDTIIPLHNVNDRLQVVFGISERSVYRLRSELKRLKQEETARFRRISSASSSSSVTTVLPTPPSPMKHNARRRKVHVTELQKDTIRLTFHLLLEDRVYPTLENLLSTLLAQEDFPVTSKTSLQRELKEMGFKYGQTGQCSDGCNCVSGISSRILQKFE
ncbi:unnamed protein product [Didymodactylos carnosus]|uniref:Uncharacterized protein n=1 Tax=Didymodactylos carnosus TaxID=1234261 RepID=A0A8S2V5L6_9BILA|nr:unnamed protein product [Didymodactylos carnosus]